MMIVKRILSPTKSFQLIRKRFIGKREQDDSKWNDRRQALPNPNPRKKTAAPFREPLKKKAVFV
jgi:hypothetical protein